MTSKHKIIKFVTSRPDRSIPLLEILEMDRVRMTLRALNRKYPRNVATISSTGKYILKERLFKGIDFLKKFG